MMDEGKVQVESQQDIDYLQTEFTKYLAGQGLPSGFVERVFSIVKENVQIDGVDWEEAVRRKTEQAGGNVNI